MPLPTGPCTLTDLLRSGPPPERGEPRESEARNSGSNLFVTGIHPRLNEQDVMRMFEKYGEVEGCSIMKDPHTQESRGFGFVKMVTSDQADAAKEGLQGENIEGRTLSIEKARRSRPRTPTPGKYFGPPKRGKHTTSFSMVKGAHLLAPDDFRGPPPPRGGRYGGYDRYDDRRRGGGYGGGGRYEDSYRSSRHDDRGYGRRDDYGSRGIDRYASGRDDRYSSRGDDRRGGSDYYSRDGGRGYGGDSAPSREPYGGGKSYEDRDDRYSRR